ncbi:MAG: hypothetical protein ACK4N5_13970, partial [Myxococcales bacterium]
TGVPLKSELTGRLVAPSDDGTEATLEFKVATEISDVGAQFAVKPPAEFLPDEDRPDGVAAALKRFEIKRVDPAATDTSAAPAPVEPEDAE